MEKGWGQGSRAMGSARSHEGAETREAARGPVRYPHHGGLVWLCRDVVYCPGVSWLTAGCPLDQHCGCSAAARTSLLEWTVIPLVARKVEWMGYYQRQVRGGVSCQWSLYMLGEMLPVSNSVA